MLKQLSDQDAGFLYLETAETPQHVGGLNLVEIPPDYTQDFFEVYKAHIKSRMHLIPFMHSKLFELPFDLDRPFWLEDDKVDIDYHVRHETLPKPGNMQMLEELVGRLHSSLLDRSRPLWEFHVIDGLESGNIAIYTKIHHAAMDGASSQLLVTTMYDPSPEPRAVPAAGGTAGDTTASLESIVQGVFAHFVRQEIRAAQFVPELMKAWTNMLLPNLDTLRYDGLPKAPRTPHTLFNVDITNQRLYAARTLSLSACKKLSKATGTTVNDVILAICSGALRTYLLAKNQLPVRSLTAMVPVSPRAGAEGATPNNNALFVGSLATDVADPYERLMAIHESSEDQKRRLGQVKNLMLPDLALIGSGGVVRRMVEVYGRAKLAQRLPLLANLTISNVPGPPIPLYLVGLRVLSLYPCSIPFHGSALNITVQSYVDRLDVGLIACRRTVPDLQVIADGLEASWTELQQAVFDHLTAHVPEVKPGNERAGKGTDKPAKPTKSAAKRGAKRDGASKKRRSPATSDIVALRPESSDGPTDPGGVDKRAAEKA
jgi:WS/DGAT/MGAT family acyltransferase